MKKFSVAPGTKVGLLTIQERVIGVTKWGQKVWRCACDCGAIREVPSGDLARGSTWSCGCANKISRPKHGMHTTPIYFVWQGMRQRCDNPNHAAYKDYGGRGIDYDPRWKDFTVFLSDMSDGNKEGLTLDRIDNDKGYYRNNCRWVTRAAQCLNRRSNVRFEVAGKIVTMSQLASMYGIPYGLLQDRYRRYGWEIQRCLTEPLHAHHSSRLRNRETSHDNI